MRKKVELSVHKPEAKAFYDELETSHEAELILSFDCQSKQVIAMIPDQAAYYLRHMYIYSFSFCQGISMTNYQKTRVFSYVWLEN